MFDSVQIHLNFEFNQSMLSLQNWYLQISPIELPSNTVYLMGYHIWNIQNLLANKHLCIFEFSFPFYKPLSITIHTFRPNITSKGHIEKDLRECSKRRELCSTKYWEAMFKYWEVGYRAFGWKNVSAVSSESCYSHIPQIRCLVFLNQSWSFFLQLICLEI